MTNFVFVNKLNDCNWTVSPVVVLDKNENTFSPFAHDIPNVKLLLLLSLLISSTIVIKPVVPCNVKILLSFVKPIISSPFIPCTWFKDGIINVIIPIIMNILVCFFPCSVKSRL